jgi:short chain dehydrogenase
VDLHLRDRRALVTAASSGIGKACAAALAEEGAEVFVCARTPERLANAAQETGARGFLAADLTSSADIDRLLAAAVDTLGGLDILVTNVPNPSVGGFGQMTDEEWDRAHQATLMSVVRLIRLGLPWLVQSSAPRIVNLSSTAAHEVLAGRLLSATYRSALAAMVKAPVGGGGSPRRDRERHRPGQRPHPRLGSGLGSGRREPRPARPSGVGSGGGGAVRLPLLCSGLLHHRTDDRDRRRRQPSDPVTLGRLATPLGGGCESRHRQGVGGSRLRRAIQGAVASGDSHGSADGRRPCPHAPGRRLPPLAARGPPECPPTPPPTGPSRRHDTGWVVLADPEGEAVSGVTATIAAGDCHRLGLRSRLLSRCYPSGDQPQ